MRALSQGPRLSGLVAGWLSHYLPSLLLHVPPYANREQYSLSSCMACNIPPASLQLSGLAQQYASFRLAYHFADFIYAAEGRSAGRHPPDHRHYLLAAAIAPIHRLRPLPVHRAEAPACTWANQHAVSVALSHPPPACLCCVWCVQPACPAARR